MKNLLLLLAFFFIVNLANGQNGYRLEFESTVLLSLDEYPMPSVNTTRTKTYTVPSGHVLKVNSGRLFNYLFSAGGPTYLQRCWMEVGSGGSLNTISPSMAKIDGAAAEQGITNYEINADNTIWVNAGQPLKINFNNGYVATTNLNSIGNCWCSGVLFRKIAN